MRRRRRGGASADGEGRSNGVTPARFGSDWWFGLGAGIGMHYTFRSGFTLGLTGVMGLPIISLGYRF